MVSLVRPVTDNLGPRGAEMVLLPSPLHNGVLVMRNDSTFDRLMRGLVISLAVVGWLLLVYAVVVTS